MSITQQNKGRWESYALIDGLPDVNILSILEDEEGCIWFGTEDGGVSRYDGQSFETFTTEDGLVSNCMISIKQDRKGNLWFGSGGWDYKGGGVTRYDGHSFVNFTTKDGLVNNNVWSILVDKEDNIWFATSGGVSRYDGKSFVSLSTKNGLPHYDVRAIVEDREGNIWFGTYWIGGISRYDGKKFVKLDIRSGLVDNRVTSILVDKEDNLWIGTYGGGISRYDGQSFENFASEDGLADNRITSILEDREGNLWFGTYGGGVSRYDGQAFTNLTTEDGLADNRVMSILEDREGYLWFGTYSAVSRYDRGGFVVFGIEDGLPNNDVRAITTDQHGYFWFGTADGVSRYDGNSFTTFRTESGLAHNDIRSIAEDKDGNLWFGTYSGGVSRFCSDPRVRGDSKAWEKFYNFTAKDGLAGNHIWTIMADRYGCLWFGTNNGISRYDGAKFVNFTTKDGLAHDHVWSIIEDRQGRLWFGTLNGISCYDGERFTTFTTENGLAHNHVWSIMEDMEGRLWFATRNGVSCYNGQYFRTITVKDGLSCKNIRCILEDKEGYLWFGTNGGGVCKYDGVNFQNITTRDGLTHDTVRQIFQDKMGNLWFATPNRVIKHILPSQKVKPRVRITQAIADEVYQEPDNIESPSTQVTFEYKGLSFKTRFNRIKYTYKLDGLDTSWSQATYEHRKIYKDLKPGEYIFQVKAIDRDLNYSDAAQVKLKVIPDPRNHHIAQLEEQIRQKERAEMERMYRELEDARHIQRSLLPVETPKIQGFEIAGISLPAKEVSGDFYDYLYLGDNFGIALADVAGKSVRAAMVASMANGMMHSAVKGQRDIWDSPGRILSELNTALQPRLISEMFTTMSLAILQVEKKRLVFSNAGMPYPIIKRGDKTRQLEVNGLPLGIMDYAEYDELSTDIEAGDLIIFYSDGVTDATNKEGKFYQFEGLLKVLQKASSYFSAQEMMDWIVNDINDFVEDMEPSDDITIVVLRCRPASASPN